MTAKSGFDDRIKRAQSAPDPTQNKDELIKVSIRLSNQNNTFEHVKGAKKKKPAGCFARFLEKLGKGFAACIYRPFLRVCASAGFFLGRHCQVLDARNPFDALEFFNKLSYRDKGKVTAYFSEKEAFEAIVSLVNIDLGRVSSETAEEKHKKILEFCQAAQLGKPHPSTLHLFPKLKKELCLKFISYHLWTASGEFDSKNCFSAMHMLIALLEEGLKVGANEVFQQKALTILGAILEKFSKNAKGFKRFLNLLFSFGNTEDIAFRALKALHEEDPKRISVCIAPLRELLDILNKNKKTKNEEEQHEQFAHLQSMRSFLKLYAPKEEEKERLSVSPSGSQGSQELP